MAHAVSYDTTLQLRCSVVSRDGAGAESWEMQMWGETVQWNTACCPLKRKREILCEILKPRRLFRVFPHPVVLRGRTFWFGNVFFSLQTSNGQIPRWVLCTGTVNSDVQQPQRDEWGLPVNPSVAAFGAGKTRVSARQAGQTGCVWRSAWCLEWPQGFKFHIRPHGDNLLPSPSCGRDEEHVTTGTILVLPVGHHLLNCCHAHCWERAGNTFCGGKKVSLVIAENSSLLAAVLTGGLDGWVSCSLLSQAVTEEVRNHLFLTPWICRNLSKLLHRVAMNLETESEIMAFGILQIRSEL